jgi:hypothetical protein
MTDLRQTRLLFRECIAAVRSRRSTFADNCVEKIDNNMISPPVGDD